MVATQETMEIKIIKMPERVYSKIIAHLVGEAIGKRPTRQYIGSPDFWIGDWGVRLEKGFYIIYTNQLNNDEAWKILHVFTRLEFQVETIGII